MPLFTPGASDVSPEHVSGVPGVFFSLRQSYFTEQGSLSCAEVWVVPCNNLFPFVSPWSSEPEVPR